MNFEKLQKLIAEQFSVNIEDITPEASFADDLGLDSLDLYEVVVDMEDELGITIDDDELENIVTVGDAWEIIKKHLD